MDITKSTTAFEQGIIVANTQRDDNEIITRIRVSQGSENGKSIFRLYKSSGPIHGDCYGVVNGEIVLGSKDTDYYGIGGGTDRVGLTSLNGAYVYDPEEPEDTLANAKAMRMKLRNNLTLLGVARNDAPYDIKDSTRDQTMFVTIVGGTKTMYNTGDGDIQPGDIVCWDLPNIEYSQDGLYKPWKRSPIGGIEDQKLMPMLVSLKSSMDGDIDYIADKFSETHSTYTKAKAEPTEFDIVNSTISAIHEFINDIHTYEKTTGQQGVDKQEQMRVAVQRLLSDILELYRDAGNRVIGKAVTGGRQGQKVDVLIGSRCI